MYGKGLRSTSAAKRVAMRTERQSAPGQALLCVPTLFYVRPSGRLPIVAGGGQGDRVQRSSRQLRPEIRGSRIGPSSTLSPAVKSESRPLAPERTLRNG